MDANALLEEALSTNEVKGSFENAEEIRAFLKEKFLNKANQIGPFVELTNMATFMSPMEQNIPELSVKPLELTHKGAPRVVMVFMIFALASASVCLFLFVREFAMRKQAAFELTRTEQARVQLEQSLVQLQAEMANQREEINQLNSELKAASAKAELIDKLQEEHSQQISRVTGRYEGQIASLQKALESKDSLIASLQSNLKSVRALIRKVETPIGIAAKSVVPEVSSVPPTPEFLLTGAAEIRSSIGFEPASGTVLMINREQRFIITDLSATAGVSVGRFIQVYRNGALIGQGRIDRIHQNLSAATIVSDDAIDQIEKGDQVFLVLS